MDVRTEKVAELWRKLLRRVSALARKRLLASTPHPTGWQLVFAGRASQTSESDAASEPTSWFFIGDTIDWLKTHDNVTGVGRVTCELYMASLKNDRHRFLPCIAGANPCGLVAVPSREIALYLTARVGTCSTFDFSVEREIAPIERNLPSFPSRGDHVVFTGVVWNRHFEELFVRLNKQGIAFSILIHDIIPIEAPHLVNDTYRSEFTTWLQTAVALARVIYVSGVLIRDQIIRWSILAEQEIVADIVVVQFGLSTYSQDARSANLSKHGLAARHVDLCSFVLSVGTIDKRKNQSLLCRAWAKLVTELGLESIPQLILVGRDDLDLSQSSEGFGELIKTKKIVILQGLSDSDLFELYKACLFTVFPSVSEGYGLPVAESLSLGKLCIASDLPTIRDHAGNLPWYFDPTDEDAILAELRRAIVQPEERRAAEQRILADFRASTWSSTFNVIATAVASTRQTSNSGGLHSADKSPC